MTKKENDSMKDKIATALMELMTKKNYLDITVTDIVNTAQVARASFYRNFKSVSDVIDYIVDHSSMDFEEEVLPALVSNDERKWREFLFEYFYRTAKIQKKMETISYENISVMFSRVNSRIQMREKESPVVTLKDKYTDCGKMGLISNIARKWLDDGMKETPEEMIDYMMSFITLF